MKNFITVHFLSILYFFINSTNTCSYYFFFGEEGGERGGGLTTKGHRIEVKVESWEPRLKTQGGGGANLGRKKQNETQA